MSAESVINDLVGDHSVNRLYQKADIEMAIRIAYNAGKSKGISEYGSAVKDLLDKTTVCAEVE